MKHKFYLYKQLTAYSSLAEVHQKSGFSSKQVYDICKKAGCDMSRPHTWLEYLRNLPYSEWEEDYSYF